MERAIQELVLHPNAGLQVDYQISLSHSGGYKPENQTCLSYQVWLTVYTWNILPSIPRLAALEKGATDILLLPQLSMDRVSNRI
ncbi:MAG: hypothetical protein EA367_19255 [Leptolyngbya sp. DLM2.Bin15]|nr:MAG: hypothetical protein EA367_19255 [Leptolyngbya sp. DLM2.Bin15]